MRRRRFNPKYRLGQKVAYEHPRIKSQMRGIIDEIDGDVYYVRDFGGFSETMTPIQDEDILGVLDFQGYIIKDKPKRKKFLGLFNPKSDRQKMEDLIDRYEYVENLLATQTRTKKEKRALIAGLCEIREQIKSLEVEGFGDFRSQTYTQRSNPDHSVTLYLLDGDGNLYQEDFSPDETVYRMVRRRAVPITASEAKKLAKSKGEIFYASSRDLRSSLRADQQEDEEWFDTRWSDNPRRNPYGRRYQRPSLSQMSAWVEEGEIPLSAISNRELDRMYDTIEELLGRGGLTSPQRETLLIVADAIGRKLEEEGDIDYQGFSNRTDSHDFGIAPISHSQRVRISNPRSYQRRSNMATRDPYGDDY